MPDLDPGRARDYQREYCRLRRSGEARTTPVPAPFRLKAAADVVALIEEQVAAVRADEGAGTLEKARTIGFLAGVALGAIEALEGVLKQRREARQRCTEKRPPGRVAG